MSYDQRMTSLHDVFKSIADDLAAQGMSAHLEGRPDASKALYGTSAAIGRALTDHGGALGAKDVRRPVRRLRRRP